MLGGNRAEKPQAQTINTLMQPSTLMDIRAEKQKFRSYVRGSVNGKRISVYIDSGNAAQSAIGIGVAHLLKIPLRKLRPPPSKPILAANGDKMKCLGSTTIHLKFDDLKGPPTTNTIKLEVLVLPELISDINMSGISLSHHKIDILYSKQALRYKDQFIPLYRTAACSNNELTDKQMTLLQISEDSPIRTFTTTKQTLQPRSVSQVEVQLQSCSNTHLNYLFDFSEKFHQKYLNNKGDIEFSTINEEQIIQPDKNGICQLVVHNPYDYEIQLSGKSYTGQSTRLMPVHDPKEILGQLKKEPTNPQPSKHIPIPKNFETKLAQRTIESHKTHADDVEKIFENKCHTNKMWEK